MRTIRIEPLEAAELPIDPMPAAIARVMNSDDWVPGSGGLERPFRARSGAILLYCWNRRTGEHAYLDVASDMILSDAEADRHMETFVDMTRRKR